ncbi:MAG: hydrogenase maturation protease [Sulfurovum sp.]|nr:hydrogenase maturation protease [Sulfurovum sp.]
MIFNSKCNIGILGVGNTLLSDEGFGPYFIDYLYENCEWSDKIEVTDGGASGIMLSPYIESKEYLYIVDVIDIDSTPGDIYVFDESEIRAKDIQSSLSVHKIGLIEIIELNKINDYKTPKVIEYIGIVPESLEIAEHVSSTLKDKTDDILNILIKKISLIDDGMSHYIRKK